MANKIDVNKLVTVKTVIISNCHLMIDDCDVLNANQFYEYENGEQGRYWINGTAGGWIIRLHACPCWLEELTLFGLSSAAIETIQILARFGFDAVQFDCDGDQVDGLNSFDW